MDELQSLVDLALSDGAVSDAEMNHLRSKATTIGIDEATLLKLIDLRKSVLKGNSETDVNRCPNCKNPVKELATNCEWCGQSLAKVVDRKTVTQYHQRIMAAGPKERAALISSYPLPIAKQDIIEILSIAVPSSRQFTDQEKLSYVIRGNVGWGNAVYDESLYAAEAEQRAWGSKARAIIDNATFLYKDDSSFVVTVKSFDGELDKNINRNEYNDKRNLKAAAGGFALMIFVLLFCLLMAALGF